MYKFVRYEQKLGNTTYKSDWMFVPQNLNDVEDFHRQYVLNICNKEFEDCVKSVVKYGDNSFCKNTEKQFFNGNHAESVFQTGLTYQLQLNKDNKSWIELANDMVVQVYYNRVKSFNKGTTLMYRRDSLVSTPLVEKIHNIIETKYISKIEFPILERPTENDINIISWPGGKHYYAKVGNYDVVVNGVQKWNTKYEAREAAKTFINSL